MIKQFVTGSQALKDFLASISEKFLVKRGLFFVECWTVPGEVSLRMSPEIPIAQLPNYLAIKQDLEGCHD